MAIDWRQVGTDFQQKYEATYCRYTSPITRTKEVFFINGVTVNGEGPPDIGLFNSRVGDIFLNYNTEADLDFTFPEIGYFQHKGKAYRFTRSYQRQWSKGVSDRTAKVLFPYNMFYPVDANAGVKEETLASAYAERRVVSLSEAKEQLKDGAMLVALNQSLALGLGHKKDDDWLWFEDELIAQVTGKQINLHMPVYLQELQDFIRNTRDYEYRVV